MSDSADSRKKIGPFQLERELGVGGMGIVYLATYEKNGMKCAVKVLAPDLTANDSINQRFVRETEILKKLQHPNIIRYFGAGSNRTQRFYAMELIEGGSLDQIIRQEGRLSWEKAIDYGLQITKALEHAHNAGIVHRDLKPGNLLITKDGKLKLSDFGIARDTQATALTQAGKTVGTMAYMAPEQISGKYPVNRRTDLYALGCVLFELLTGRVPFTSETQAELLFKHLDEPAPSVRDFNMAVPLPLAQLIDELLSKHPEDRPFDALAVQVKLEEIRDFMKQQEAKAAHDPTAGGANDLTRMYDKTLAGDTKKKKKSKKKTTTVVPVWERAWFLSLILAVLLGGAGYVLWNSRQESTIFARVSASLAKSPPDWFAIERDVKRMLVLHPQGEHAQRGQELLDEIEMNRVETRVDALIKRNQMPDDEAGRLYTEAKQYERFGDRFTALERYENMPIVLEQDAQSEKVKPFLNLARKRAAEIRAEASGDTDRTAFIRRQLDEADQMYKEGRTLQAREKWQAVVRLYGALSEFENLTTQARDKLKDTEPSRNSK